MINTEKVNLHQSYKVGQVINLKGGVYSIVSRTGLTCNCLPGGTGVQQYEVLKIQDGALTEKELQQLQKA